MNKATYSPEDNKLRLYPDSRLDPETYAKVKAAGFIWAPKQELFVAPMWTPGRENLLIELCDEIGDEDASLVDRAEERADRFQDYSANRLRDSESAQKAVSAISDNIPLGQPILVGHHSEKHARRDAERIENGMRKAVKMWDQAQYWKSRAAGAIRTARYKERPDVRARRIKKLEAEQRKQLRAREKAQVALKFWIVPELTKERALQVCANSDLGWMAMPRKEGDKADHSGTCHAYDALRGNYENLYAPRTFEEVRDQAKIVYPNIITHCERWIAHYSNRLEYERAMLGESGGIATDRKGPEKGGACKCWCSRGSAWSYIQKVNKVSVSVLDNWGNGGPCFNRTVPFDKLGSIMTKAEVDQALAAGRIRDTEDKTGFYLTEKETPCGYQTTPDSCSKPNEEDRQKTDCINCDSGTQRNITAIKEALKNGVKVVSAPQLFPTPAPIAKRMIDAAAIPIGARVLEPSAGMGALLQAFPGVMPFIGTIRQTWAKEVIAVEKIQSLAESLDTSGLAHRVICSDFLDCSIEGIGYFDRIIMNPPFENGSDIKHIMHAIEFLRPGGRLVALCANGPRQQRELADLGEYIELPAGSFKESGTNVNVSLLIVDKE